MVNKHLHFFVSSAFDQEALRMDGIEQSLKFKISGIEENISMLEEVDTEDTPYLLEKLKAEKRLFKAVLEDFKQDPDPYLALEGDSCYSDYEISLDEFFNEFEAKNIN